MSPSRSMRNLSLNIALCCCATVFAFGTGELAARFIAQAPPFETPLFQPSYLTAKDADLRWRFSPGSGRNRLGLKNRELTPKAEGERRILFLGDSLVWAGETTSGKLYTEVVEDRLRDLDGTAAGRPITTVNAGIPGYTTYQELEFLRQYGEEMQPTFLVLGFVFNDVYYKYLHRPTKENLLAREPTKFLQFFDTHTSSGRLLAQSYLAHLAVLGFERAAKRLTGTPVFPFELRGDFSLAWKPYGWRHTPRLLTEMKAWADQRGIQVLVLIFPVSDQVNEQYRTLNETYVLYPQSRIKDICDEIGIRYLDLTDAIYSHGGTSLYMDYLHLNERGNDVVADTVVDYLKANPRLWAK